MKRRLLDLLTALSLLLCVAVCVLWVRSYQRRDIFGWVWAGGGPGAAEPFLRGGRTVFVAQAVMLQSSSGVLRGNYYNPARATTLGPFQAGDRPILLEAISGRRMFSAGFYASRGTEVHEILIPHWCGALVSAALPAVWLAWRWREYRRRPAGLCSSCGYDLRATPGRCPECGTHISTETVNAPTPTRA